VLLWLEEGVNLTKPLRKEEVRRETDVKPLEEILDEVAQDAASLEDSYLSETIVPEGGE